MITPAACAITSISLDHRELLGDTLALIAAEKAGIMKPGIPTITGEQPAEALAALENAGPVLRRGRDWWIAPDGAGLRYGDAAGELALPTPGLLGRHQIDNAGIAVAAIRAAGLGITEFAGLARASWPARLQRLHGRLAALVPDRELWLDGGHNPGGGEALATQLAEWGPTHLLVGMKQAKDTAEFLRPLLPHAASLWAVQEPGQHSALPVEAIRAASGGLARPGPHPSRRATVIGRHAGPRADLRQPLPRGRGAEGGWGRADMIDRLTEADRPRWTELWTAYLTFYETVLPPEQYDHTWQRLMTGKGLYGFGLRHEGRLVGITHYLFHESG